MAGKDAAKLIAVLPTAIQKRWDAWENAITGLGTIARDKAQQLRFRRNTLREDSEWDAMYHDDDLAALLVDIIPDEALRQGFEIVIQPDSDDDNADDAQAAVDQADEILDVLDGFGTVEKFNEAWRWGRLFGGGGLLMGIDDGIEDQAEPLNEENIRSIQFIEVIDKRDFTPHSFFEDPEEALFGEPMTYLLHRASAATSRVQASRATSIEVHASRIIVFPGARTSKRKRLENGGWDFSELQKLKQTMDLFNQGWLSVGHMMTDANQGVFSIKGLVEMIASGNLELLKTRMELADYSRSAVRALLLDADGEKFERKPTAFAGIPDVLDRFMIRLSAATRIPVTILMGRSPAGQNATGESDFKAWFGRVAAMQRSILRPRLERWVRLNMLAKDGPTGGQEPEKWNVSFPSLWQMTPAEQAELEKQTSEKDENYVAMGALTPEEVKASRFRPEGFSTETIISDEEQETVETPEEMEARLTAEAEAEAEGAAPEPTPEPEGDEPVSNVDPEDAVDPGTALNGAQVAALKLIVSDVAAGLLPRETGVKMIAAAFPLSEEEADDIMGEVGKTFFVGGDDGPTDEGDDEGGDVPQPPPPPPPGAGDGSEEEGSEEEGDEV